MRTKRENEEEKRMAEPDTSPTTIMHIRISERDISILEDLRKRNYASMIVNPSYVSRVLCNVIEQICETDESLDNYD